MEPRTGKREYKVVYTIVERPRDGRKFWLRVGTAFTNVDGSLNVYLDAVPTNGQLQIRDRTDEPRVSEANAELDGLRGSRGPELVAS